MIGNCHAGLILFFLIGMEYHSPSGIPKTSCFILVVHCSSAVTSTHYKMTKVFTCRNDDNDSHNDDDEDDDNNHNNNNDTMNSTL